jgi:hypothetical protein
MSLELRFSNHKNISTPWRWTAMKMKLSQQAWIRPAAVFARARVPAAAAAASSRLAHTACHRRCRV